MVNLFLALLIFILCTNTATLHGQAVIFGKIEEQIWLENQQNGKLQPASITIFSDNFFQKDANILVVPDEQGFYNIQLPLLLPMPVIMEYNNRRLQLFLFPTDTLQLSFNAADLVKPLAIQGSGTFCNAPLIAFQQRYYPPDVEAELSFKRETTDRNSYFGLCEDMYILESTFFKGELQKQIYPQAFTNWVKAELTYRKATRLSAYYFTTNEPLQDDYPQFAATYNYNDTTAIVSNQYLLFLEYHLRHLSKRDAVSSRSLRVEKKTPWVVRGYELAKLHYTGLYREILLTRMMMDISDVLYAETPAIYSDYLLQPVTDGLRKLANDHFAAYTAKMGNVHLPPDAQLTILPPNEKTNLANTLSPFLGKVIYIDFWASWCAPCLLEMQHSRRLQQMYEGENVAFVFISLDSTADMWRTKIAELGIGGHHFLLNVALQAELTELWNLGAIPRYFIVNKRGLVVNDSAPPPGSAEIVTQLNNLLNE
ncbi:TlpA family protein disulfide reductase [Sphingobacteriales bacterium UPWRP_1]|nr:hypothetical protein B6N25_02850 [Sphingobacteriales bacterium TSM_CSS]PSJ75992.1 TlpA family protein disulfide reductase [Sphingobacteriales bacterium UPWRP_1]